MPSIEEMAEGPKVEMEMLPMESIDLDPENPNEMDDTLYDALVAEIRDYGFAQPVAVWPLPGEGERYRMIDGEHRFRALSDLGASQVPAVIVPAESEDDARLRLLSMNRLRGQFIPIKLAYLLKDLATRIPEAEMRKRLGMDQGELRDALRLADFTDPVQDRLRYAVEREQKDAPTVMKFVLSSRDAAVVERVVDKLVEGKTDRGKALAAICRAYEKGAK